MLAQGPNATLFRVMVGPFADAAALGKAKADLESAGFHPLSENNGGEQFARKFRRAPPRVRAPRLPEWLRKPRTHSDSVHHLKSELRRLNLHTVCESARCPNMHECFHCGTATFMILGNLCTRGCGFCSVPKGSPTRQDMRLDPHEPANVARMAAQMKLRYVVITSVNRDDLADGGSHHFAETVHEVRCALPEARIEVLTPDFAAN